MRILAYAANGVKKDLSLKDLSLTRYMSWIDLENPSQQDLRLVAQKCRVPVRELRHSLDQYERPRLKVGKDYRLIIFAAPAYKEDEEGKTTKHVRPMGLIIGKRFLITIHKEKVVSLQNVKASSPELKEVMAQGSEFLAASLLYDMQQEFSPVLDRLEDDVGYLEDEALQEDAVDGFLPTISKLKHSALLLRRAMASNKDLGILVLQSSTFKEKDKFEEWLVEMMQGLSQVELARERMSTALDIYFAQSSARVNNVMKSLTVVAAVMLLPMFITGVYGMNVSLPGQEHPHMFIFLLLVVIVALVFLVTYFKQKRFI